MTTVAVVGGGVSGLATAWFLTSRTTVDVLVFEAGPTLGGKVRTRLLAGLPLEDGPDGFLPGPEVVALCEELGLGTDLVGTRTSEAYVWSRGGLRRLSAGDSPRGRPPDRFLTIRGGLERLVEALRSRLTGTDVRRCTEVRGLERTDGGTLLLRTRSGTAVPADCVVLAVPAAPAAHLLVQLIPEVSAALAGLRYLDLAVVNLVYPGRPWRLPGSGFLVPQDAGLPISSCTWLSAKWPQFVSDRCTAVRVTVAGPDWSSMDDAGLVDLAHRELTHVLGIGPPPAEARVARWVPALVDPRCLDRELVRRAQRVARAEGVLLAAGGYLGGGVASCVAEASAVAAEAAHRLR